jgi:tetratricopeptide (TPR) repeat protein
MEKGLFSLAIKEYEKILEVIERDDPYYIEIKYELGNAQMMNEEYKEALETFNQIKEIDPGFRDISDKIKTVEQKLSGPVRQGKRRDRVSYI